MTDKYNQCDMENLSLNQKILSVPAGSLIMASDFKKAASYEAVRQALSRLAKKEKIVPVICGIYLKPRKGEDGSNAQANPLELAKKIAKKNSWTIFPAEEMALRAMGLQTSDTTDIKFASSGPNREYEYAGVKIVFHHRSNRLMDGLSETSGLLVQAIDAKGKDQMTDEDREAIRKALIERKAKAEKILDETEKTYAWIYEEIRLILEKGLAL